MKLCDNDSAERTVISAVSLSQFSSHVLLVGLEGRNFHLHKIVEAFIFF